MKLAHFVSALMTIAIVASELPAQTRTTQIAAESKWPDDSIEWLDVDFNATMAPVEEQIYRLEYGSDVKAAITRFPEQKIRPPRNR